LRKKLMSQRGALHIAIVFAAWLAATLAAAVPYLSTRPSTWAHVGGTFASYGRTTSTNSGQVVGLSSQNDSQRSPRLFVFRRRHVGLRHPWRDAQCRALASTTVDRLWVLLTRPTTLINTRSCIPAASCQTWAAPWTGRTVTAGINNSGQVWVISTGPAR